VTPLLKKAKVLDKLRRGMSTAAVRCNYVVVRESTIGFLKKNEEKNKGSLKNSAQ
jgi:hypothetical protein